MTSQGYGHGVSRTNTVWCTRSPKKKSSLSRADSTTESSEANNRGPECPSTLHQARRPRTLTGRLRTPRGRYVVNATPLRYVAYYEQVGSHARNVVECGGRHSAALRGLLRTSGGFPHGAQSPLIELSYKICVALCECAQGCVRENHGLSFTIWYHLNIPGRFFYHGEHGVFLFFFSVFSMVRMTDDEMFTSIY